MTEHNYIDDSITVPQLIYYAKNIIFLDQPLYYYLDRKDSGINTLSTKKIDDVFDVYFSLKCFLMTIGKYDIYMESLEGLFWRTLRFVAMTGTASYEYTKNKELISYLSNKAITENIPGVEYYFPHRYYLR